MNLREPLNLRFLDRVITSPEGRTHPLFWQAVKSLSGRSEPPLTQFAYAEVA
jgi:hypothetical protein